MGGYESLGLMRSAFETRKLKISNGIWTNVASNYVNVHWKQVLICSQRQALASSNAFGHKGHP